ncbi:uncharacterized protein LOC135811701 [Sycon ciliatum]|uniref:uncharacterized protein LOC135811701 n=1 Tax=Sycon ciliatum TaxID=27933 RepID=UPI0031F68C1F
MAFTLLALSRRLPATGGCCRGAVLMHTSAPVSLERQTFNDRSQTEHVAVASSSVNVSVPVASIAGDSVLHWPRAPVVSMTDGLYRHRSCGIKPTHLEIKSRVRVITLGIIRAWLKKRNQVSPYSADTTLEIYDQYKDFGVSALSFASELQLKANIIVARPRTVHLSLLQDNLVNAPVTVDENSVTLLPERLDFLRKYASRFDIVVMPSEAAVKMSETYPTILKDEGLFIVSHAYQKALQCSVDLHHFQEATCRFMVLRFQTNMHRMRRKADLITTIPIPGGVVMAFDVKKFDPSQEEVQDPVKDAVHCTTCEECRYHGTTPIREDSLAENWFKVHNLHSFRYYHIENRDSCSLCNKTLSYSHPLYGGPLRPKPFLEQVFHQFKAVHLAGHDEFFDMLETLALAEVDVPFGPLPVYFGPQLRTLNVQHLVNPLLSLGHMITPSLWESRGLKTTATQEEFFQTIHKVAEFENIVGDKRSSVIRNCEKLPRTEERVAFVQLNPRIQRLFFMIIRLFHPTVPNQQKGHRDATERQLDANLRLARRTQS